MKTTAALALCSILSLSACAGHRQVQEGDRPSTAAPAAHDYRCRSGETIVASYPSTDSATVQYKGTTYDMRIAVSGSGARYVGGGLEWWTKGSGPGSDGMLYRHAADGTSGDSLEACTAS